ncbi:hypothetical protein [Rhizobium laguerreae]|uniref:hypothetical protein n=1 Tax=Rhizobium laguerreae TaxID=1076926 RepID=UPI001C920AD3|nr:hypothetical protein [Rhizobium laguerreae]MBY3201318.1 hypothetical protein [Rhizobium laguerreae]
MQDPRGGIAGTDAPFNVELISSEEQRLWDLAELRNVRRRESWRARNGNVAIVPLDQE